MRSKLLAAALAIGALGSWAQNLYMFVGSYAPADREGIALYAFDQDSGRARRLTGAHGVSNPSFVTFDPQRSLLYSVGEDAGSSSTINTLSVNLKRPYIKLIDSRPTYGGAPCHVELSPDRSQILTANYTGGSVTCYNLDEAGLPKGEPQVMQYADQADPQRVSHAHYATFSPDTRRLWVSDLGLDRIHTYPVLNGRVLLDSAMMTDIELPEGAGPRHTAFHPFLPMGYVIDELDGYVNVIDYQNLRPKVVQRILADSLGAHGSADIHVSPDARFVYASNRLKGDGIAIFQIEPSTGLLSYVGYQPTGPHPRNFAITPNGRYMLVACRDSNTIEVYAINPATGLLKPTRNNINFSKPVCIKLIQPMK